MVKKFILIIVALLTVQAAAALDCQGPPDAFWGSLTVNDASAEVGTEVRGIAYNEQRGIYTTTVEGLYGEQSGDDKLYIVCEEFGDPMSFEVKVFGQWFDSGEVSTCGCGAIKNLDIDVTVVGPVDADQDGFDDDVDCDDSDASVYPGAPELEDGQDNDCDGLVDEGTNAGDDDGDGYTENQGDCNDGDAAVNPGEEELCNGVDDDCNQGSVDGIDEVNYGDETGCGLGICTASGVMDCVAGSMVDTCTPGTSDDEVCDGLDNDCDGSTDEELLETFYADLDSDTYGNSGNTQLACFEPQGYVSDDTDCDDSDANVNPGEEEICDNGIDDNCDGLTDLEDDVCEGFCPDDDQDSVCNVADNCPTDYNPDQLDLDDDGIGYVCDDDTVQVEETTITIYPGWTLIGLPYNPLYADNSQELGELIMQEGTTCDLVMKYNGLTQEWEDDILAIADPSFNLNGGEGYFVFCDSQVDFTYGGTLW